MLGVENDEGRIPNDERNPNELMTNWEVVGSDFLGRDAKHAEKTIFQVENRTLN